MFVVEMQVVLFGETDPAVKLVGNLSAFFVGVAAPGLGHGHLFGAGEAGANEGGGLVGDQPRGIQKRGHVRAVMLNHLQDSEGLPTLEDAQKFIETHIRPEEVYELYAGLRRLAKENFAPSAPAAPAGEAKKKKKRSHK